MNLKLGSLFDGSGGFPLSGSMCGIEPVWASEVEPYPIAVTRSRFPNMKHLGDISKINGAEVEPVDIITFGSPCQDLSVAGKRAGLKHEANGDEETTRSGLFMEAVRIIKEMRRATNGVYPRFALWENVPGAFSSNKGEDFRIVLEELIKIVEPAAVMPAVPKNGWPYADSYCGDGWSLAYRVFDAQYWGVPQRRRRIHLVLDLTAECAREVSFEREGVRGYFETGRTPWKAAAGDTENRSGATDREGKCYGISSFCSNAMLSDNPHSGIYEAKTSRTLDLNGGNPACNQGGIAIVESIPIHDQTTRSVCYNGENITSPLNKTNPQPGDPCHTLGTDSRNYVVHCLQGNGIDRADTAGCNGAGWREGASYTLNTIDRPAIVYAETYQKTTGPLMANSHPGSYSGQDAYNDMFVVGRELPVYSMKSIARNGVPLTEQANPICASDYKDPDVVALPIATGADCRNATEYPEMTGALQADAAHNLNSNNVVRVQYIVRRLTPTECARLQGFPDEWGHPDIKETLTDEEYDFWLNVRNTHATVIGGKEAKDYTKAQMLTWYNKLHTDSAEYKMWGNGIALPPALYIMQGMAEALSKSDKE